MFNLSRYFSTLSFVLIVLAAGGLGLLYRELSLHQISELAESRNVAMAQIFENALRQPLERLISASIGRDGGEMLRSGEIETLRASSQALMRNTAVIKVKIYNRLGLTVFSTDARQVGESRLENPGFRSAINGVVLSELVHRNTADTMEGSVSDVDLLSSYIPIYGEGHMIEGVFELYQDVSPFMAQSRRSLWWVMAGVLSVCAALYLMQFLVVRRAQRILKEQEGRIKAARDTLEIQVDARTAELKRANSQLEEEVGVRRQAESKLNYLAYHDPLTGLANRRCFIERLEESMQEAVRSEQRLAVLFIDLDQFKQVNDSLGHGVGDELLVSVASRLSEHVRLIDMLARLGGDEFICLMEGVRDAEDVALLAQEINAAFAAVFLLGEHELFLSASIGICLYPGDGDNVLELMRNADTAMYRAKGQGRGLFHFYTPEMTRDARERIRLENLLRGALDNGEISLHFQPQVDAADGRLVGAEALARWDSPRLGSVSPVRFIPLAEDSGMIIALGSWVLRESCRQIVQWQAAGFDLPQVSVNISVKQLERPGFVSDLAAIIAETGVTPACLKLEITESVVLAMADACALLERVRALGVTLALDDFGTGYSSLSYLKLLPVDQLKIDRSFIIGIGSNSGDEAIIETVMALARSLGFEVLAEGVETVGQAEFLSGHGCHQFQGFLYGKAVAADEFQATWQARP
ncbi:putative bifunctional diguanylate cyclase/phosphodiesterase [Quatrionicoccus australiensis]|uniref:putative bifunctional diguanylate cyclase/phosphodiesterase n=1 Tax=Quatrionicoccus australiensis TaxID=138118 RepID=UPI001CFB9ECB|nr:EAL domain-containing protein [Quatrionicoccus australiensis]MCB4361697.1 EAL domain-containing protein [Quatrionicoccus australiensis]